MRIGLILPTFADNFDEPLRALEEIEAAGLDGGFVYDHLWPMYHREDPAIAAFPALAALAHRRGSVTLGTLVARVANVAPKTLERELRSLFEIAHGAFIAGIGTADHKSAEEYLGYGLEFPHADVRREQVRVVTASLIGAGVPVWIGGGARATNELARELGATLNLWGVSTERLRLEAEDGPVSWAGRLPEDRGEAAITLIDLAEAGATWAVFTWPRSLPLLREAIDVAEEHLRRAR